MGIFLSLFINQQLGMFAFGFIAADQEEVHACHDAQTAVAAKQAFQLVAQIGGVVIEKRHTLTIRQAIGDVYKLAR